MVYPASSGIPYQQRFEIPEAVGNGAFVESNAGNNSYNSLQVSLEKRFTRGLTILSSYTWSKTTNDLNYNVNFTGSGAGGGFTLPFYTKDMKALDRGPADFDRTHIFSTSFVYQLPTLTKSHWAVRHLAGGWQLTGIYSFMSGLPLTILSGQDVDLMGFGNRAMVLGTARGAGACGTSAPCVDWLVPSSFAIPTTGQIGNSGKGNVRGPIINRWDTGFFKNIPVTERVHMQFRAEFFNFFNHPNFNNPTLTRSSGGFGRITSAQDPRIGQLALKIFW